MRTDQLRRAYLDFFQDLDHKVYSSAPLVPTNDPTLLFTVAGMVQFKDALTGAATPETPRAVSCQLCMRAGGKHNDLDNVGYTARHHTLFEMLGNFSFGEYFKEEAIDWAWKFVVDFLRFEKERIWITIHPTDDEAKDLWVRKIGIRPERVIPHSDNFWEMGNTGPCGPNTEIFYDQGDSFEGGPPGSPDEDGDRFLEFWNLVFPQFDRQPDGELAPLAAPSVDTGLGLERTAALMQGVASNFATDIFEPLFQAASRIGNVQSIEEALNTPSVRVIVDHIRSCAFLIADGVLPSNEGRGYVLRRVIRRALRHGHRVGASDGFFCRLVDPLVNTMGEAYPGLSDAQSQIESVLEQEEEKFASTLRFGMRLLNSLIQNLAVKELHGETVFKLYDTYGFPLDLTQDIAREHGLTVDVEGFEALMKEQRDRARGAGRFETQETKTVRFETEVEFEGYRNLQVEAQVLELLREDDGELVSVDVLRTGESGRVGLDRTPFYAEAGGQVGDTGRITTNVCSFDVSDTQRMDRQYMHQGKVVRGEIRTGDSVQTQVDAVRRQDVARNHTGTHLLHSALKRILGSHVSQRGSLVAPDRLRFDFAHDQPLTAEEVEQIEDSVNEQIALNTQVKTEVLPYDQAITLGAEALFGEKYGEIVRVLLVGNGYSTEFCGGTHVAATGEIGSLRIVSQSGISAGVRRIEAVTGRGAQARARVDDRALRELSAMLKTNRPGLVDGVTSLLDEKLELMKSLKQSRTSGVANVGRDLATEAETVGDVRVVSAVVDGDADALMSIYDDLRSRMQSYVIALAVVVDRRIQLVCGVSRDLSADIPASELLKFVGSQVGVRGGGKPEMARGGGGTDTDSLPTAMNSVLDWVRDRESLIAS